ncbi:hypothetical protein ACFL2D_02345 [Patescibacteria group bacterium]
MITHGKILEQCELLEKRKVQAIFDTDVWKIMIAEGNVLIVIDIENDTYSLQIGKMPIPFHRIALGPAKVSIAKLIGQGKFADAAMILRNWAQVEAKKYGKLADEHHSDSKESSEPGPE